MALDNSMFGEDLEMASINLWNILEAKINYLSKSDQEWIRLAFDVMKQAHGLQKRKSGNFYIVHPVSAATYLADICLDKYAICACLLHDVPEDTDTTLDQIKKDFGGEVAFLVSGVTKINTFIKYQGEDRYAENLRRMFLAMSKDIRVVFIKLADRLHNLRTLKFVAPEKQKRIALESLEIYAPIAQRLGISQFQGAIEDTSFPFVYPEEYKQYIHISTLEIQKRTKLVEKIIKKITRYFESDKVEYQDILGRAKRYYSIYKKAVSKNTSMEDMYDLVAIRIVTSSIEDCYDVLAYLHQKFDYMDNRVKDYIKSPKTNGYQSIHTTLTDKQFGLTFEVQIRNHQMHEFAEYGIAAHWRYKQGNDSDTIVPPETLKWLKELVSLGEQNISSEEYLREIKLDVFQDRIFVLTPKNDVISLPIGATALDFAFKIHNDIGMRAIMAKVNKSASKLNTELQSGDLVEILTGKKQNPNKDWLQLVKTAQASRVIRNYLRKSGSMT